MQRHLRELGKPKRGSVGLDQVEVDDPTLVLDVVKVGGAVDLRHQRSVGVLQGPESAEEVPAEVEGVFRNPAHTDPVDSLEAKLDRGHRQERDGPVLEVCLAWLADVAKLTNLVTLEISCACWPSDKQK